MRSETVTNLLKTFSVVLSRAEEEYILCLAYGGAVKFSLLALVSRFL